MSRAAGYFASLTMTCECPCHSVSVGSDADVKINHAIACCCPHREVIPVNCPLCMNMQADASPSSSGANCITIQEGA